jgi:hypothetical protein
VSLIGPEISADRRDDFRLIAWGNSSALTPSRVSVEVESPYTDTPWFYFLHIQGIDLDDSLTVLTRLIP